MSNEAKVYTSENLRFATKEKDRKPTLYFRSPHGCGRLRQEHSGGPKMQDIRGNMLDVFFQSQANLDQFYEAFNSIAANARTISAIHTLMADKQGVGIAFDGAFHFECTVSGKGLCSKRHRSGGNVVLGPDLEAIRLRVPAIYASFPKK